MESLETKQKKLNIISLALTNRCPEFSGILLYAPRIVTSGDFVCKTDGKIIRVGNKFFELEPYMQIYKILHMALHVGLRHHHRAVDLNGNKLGLTIWNTVTDSIINTSLKDYIAQCTQGQFTISNREDCPTIDSMKPILEKLHYDESAGYSAERMFFALLRGLDKKEIDLDALPSVDEDLSGDSFDESDEVLNKNGLVAEQGDDQLSDMLWTNRIEDVFKKAGSRLGNSMMGLLDHLEKPKVNWQAILRQFLIHRLTPETEPDYRRPSRRNLAGVTTIFEPSRIKKRGIKKMVVCLDTSGSCWCSEVQSKFIANIDLIHAQTGCELIVITFDSDVHDVITVDKNKKLANLVNNKEVALHGGGGTSFIEPIEEALNHKPSVIAVLTDCYGPFGSAPNVPTIWASIGDCAPWGKTVLIEE